MIKMWTGNHWVNLTDEEVEYGAYTTIQKFIAQEQRVRELHKPYQWDMLLRNSLLCFECSKIDERGANMFSIPYPCSTIQALDGEQ